MCQIFRPPCIYSRTPQKKWATPRCLDPDTNFRLARQRFPLFPFYETTTGVRCEQK